MRNLFNKTERGSIMIEAIAMLALITLVTPLLYKKSAERMRELQDINAAGELRSIVKAVDDYISANYDEMVKGGTISNTCTQNSISYAELKTKKLVEVPIGHFCEFLPYGILDSSGNAKISRMFSGYKIILKLQGNAEENGNNVITAFVVTDPRIDMPQLRSSSIASMIGGNGGYVTSNEGESGTTAAKGTITGNLGLWGIEDTKTELGVDVKKGAVVAASIQGISSQNANIDIDDVLYRRQRADPDLNTMFTTLYMGEATGDKFGQNIANIGQLILGKKAADEDNSKVYLRKGNIKIGSEGGNILIDGTGNVQLKNGHFQTDQGNIYTKKGIIQTDGGSLVVTNNTNSNSIEVKQTTSVFTVAKDGVTKALNFQTNNGNVLINVGTTPTTTIKEPVIVEKTDGNCTFSDHSGCALTVKGGEYVDGNLIVSGTFDAKDLHARETLTVGGTDSTKGPALTVDGKTANQATLNFGSDLFKITQTAASKGSLEFASSLIKATAGDTTTFNVTVPDAANSEIGLGTGTSNVILKQNLAKIIANNTNGLEINNGNAKLTSTNIYFNKPNSGTAPFQLTGKDNKIDTLVDTLTITPKGKTGGHFSVSNDKGTNGSMYAQALDAYFTGTNQGTPSHVYQKNSEYHMQNEDGTDVLKLKRSTDDKTYADIYAKKVLYKNNSDNTKILEIDSATLASDDPKRFTMLEADTNRSPVYIRKGIIELNAGDNKNYIKADRFIAHTQTVSGDLKTVASTGNGLNNVHTITNDNATNYIVNPAYTSIMRDIKLTSRGGARLSDILPDFINKGIYVVDNTYPAKGISCGGEIIGKSLADYKDDKNGGALATNKGYKKYQDPNDTSYFVGSCTHADDEVSPWLGFVPRPTCPPGYSGVITLTPASFAMAQAGYAVQTGDGDGRVDKTKWGKNASYVDETGHTINDARKGKASPMDLTIPTGDQIESPMDHAGEDPGDNAPTPLYTQKNTWLRSDAAAYPNNCATDHNCLGWDISMGFIYPYIFYQGYLEATGFNIGGNSNFEVDWQGEEGSGDGDGRVIWNLFPVYAGSLEGYATVYCYFNRAGGELTQFNENTVDTKYDQLDNYRIPYHWANKYSGGNDTGTKPILNAPGYDYGNW